MALPLHQDKVATNILFASSMIVASIGMIGGVMAIHHSKQQKDPLPEPAQYVQMSIGSMAAVRHADLDFDRFGVLVDQGYVSLASQPPNSNGWDHVQFTGKDGINNFDDINEGMWARVTDAAHQMMADSILLHYAVNQDLMDRAKITTWAFALDAMQHGAQASVERAAMVASGQLANKDYANVLSDRAFDIVSRLNGHRVITEASPDAQSMTMQTLMEGVYENITPDMEVITQSMTVNVNGQVKTLSLARPAESVLRTEAIPEDHDVALVNQALAMESQEILGDIMERADMEVEAAILHHQEHAEEAASHYQRNLAEVVIHRDLQMRDQIGHTQEVHEETLEAVKEGQISEADADLIIADANRDAILALNDISNDFALHVNDLDSNAILHMADIHSNVRINMMDIGENTISNIAGLHDHVVEELAKMTSGTGIVIENLSERPINDAMRVAEEIYRAGAETHIEVIQMPPETIQVDILDDRLAERPNIAAEAMTSFRTQDFRGADIRDLSSLNSIDIREEVLNVAREVRMLDETPFAGRQIGQPDLPEEPVRTLRDGRVIPNTNAPMTDAQLIQNLRHQLATSQTDTLQSNEKSLDKMSRHERIRAAMQEGIAAMREDVKLNEAMKKVAPDTTYSLEL